MVGGVFQTQLTNGADEGPMSMLAVVARHMLGVCGLAHLRRNDQQYSLRTPLWLQITKNTQSLTVTQNSFERKTRIDMHIVNHTYLKF